MIVQKWDYATHTYSDHVIPESANIVLYTQDMDLEVNCVSCLKAMTYGEGYTSHQYQTSVGFGFPVCEACYEVERELRYSK